MEKKITKALNNWLEKYGFETRVSGMGMDFTWYWDSNTIEYSFLVSENSSIAWNEFLEELGCEWNIDEFFSSFLHEVFHSVTYDDFTEEELDEYYDDVAWIECSEESSFAEGSLKAYFNLPVELAATREAVRFINTQHSAVRELVETVQPLIKEFINF